MAKKGLLLDNFLNLPVLAMKIAGLSSLVFFAHFHFEMCFPPQRRAFSTAELPKVQKWYETVSFWLWHFAPKHSARFRHLNFHKCSEHEVFLTFWLPNVLFASVHLLNLLSPDGSAPATSARLIFDPPEPQIMGKHAESRHLFAHLHLLSSAFLLLFSSLFLPTCAFSSVPIIHCRKFDF